MNRSTSNPRRFALIAAIAGAGVLLWGLFSGVEGRTIAYARFCQRWQQLWPMERGRYVPMRLGPSLVAAGMVGPVRYQVAPRVALLLEPLDVLDISLLSSGTWDEGAFDLIRSGLSPGGTYVDVGAHIGTFTLMGAAVVGDQGRVIAVEPNPKTLVRLKDNIAHNRWPNVTVVEAACGDQPGKMKLYAGGGVNTGAASLSEQNVLEHGGNAREVYDVDVVRLDDIIEKAGVTRVDVVKIDTEGAESMVVRGARRTMERFKPDMVLETLDFQLRNMGSSLAELDALMEEAGYRIDKRDFANTRYVPASRPR